MERGSLFPVARIHWPPSTVRREQRDLLCSPPLPRPIYPPPLDGLRWTPGHLGPVGHVSIAIHTQKMYKKYIPLGIRLIYGHKFGFTLYMYFRQFFEV